MHSLGLDNPRSTLRSASANTPGVNGGPIDSPSGENDSSLVVFDLRDLTLIAILTPATPSRPVRPDASSADHDAITRHRERSYAYRLLTGDLSPKTLLSHHTQGGFASELHSEADVPVVVGQVAGNEG